MTRLLDTSVCVSILRGRPKQIADRFLGSEPGDLAICSIVVAELLLGVEKARFPAIEREKVLAFTSGLVSLEFGDTEAAAYARIRAQLEEGGNIIGANDLLIAAIALRHQLTLVTQNYGEFARIKGLIVEDWTRPIT